MTNQDTTTKTYGLLAMAESEVEAARTAVLNAYAAYAENRTEATRRELVQAEKNLRAVQQQYREARSALNAYTSKRMAERRGS